MTDLQRRAWLATAAAAAAGLAGCAPLAGPAAAGDAAPAPLPAVPAGQALQRISFGSCVDQAIQPQPIWDAVLAGRPQFHLFGGDNVYASKPPWTLVQLEQAYAAQAAVPGFATLRRTVPHLAVWDDHDYGLNDGGASWPNKQAAKDAFLRFWQLPADDPRRGRDGLYHALVVGPPGRRVQFIGLDTRWFRSALKPTDQRDAPGKERYLPDDDPAKTMLGEAQWAWLAVQLRQPAELRLILSSIQVLAEGHGFERWGNLPRERQRLFDLIAATGARGVLLLSGDRHIGGFYRTTSGVPYPLTDMTASGMTHSWQGNAEPGPNRLFGTVGEHHFGRIDIDWAARMLQLSLVGEGGQVFQQLPLALDALAPA